MPENIIAVYGTLRKGLSNHQLIVPSKRIGLGWLTGFRMYNLGEYPGAISTLDTNDRIRVEWYKVSDDVLSQLDELEEYDIHSKHTSEYIREAIYTPYGKGWVYLYNKKVDPNNHMPEGDWERFLKSTA